MSKEALDALVEHGVEYANRILIEDRHKELSPMFHLISRSGSEDCVVCTPWGNDLEKKIAVAQVKSMAHKIDAVACLFMTECWMVKYPRPLTAWHAKRQDYLDVPPSQHPDRAEMVMLIAVNPENETSAAMLQIIRHKPGGRIVSLVRDNGAMGADRFESWILDGMFRPKGEK